MSVRQSTYEAGPEGTAALPVLSVIIPAYNAAPFIAEAMDSALAQTYPAIEIIVVNDGSPDTEALERVLQPYQGKFIYLKQENRGLSGARNTAIRAATGKYIGLLDADDAWMPEYARVQIAMMEQDPSIDVLYPDAELFGEVEVAGQTYMDKSPSKGPVTFASLLREDCHVMICVTMRRDTLARVGVFDEALRSVEDFDLWLRVISGGGKIVYHREMLARHRVRMGSLSSNGVAMGNYVLQVLAKARDTMTLTPSDRKELESAYQHFQAQLQLTHSKIALVQRNYAKSAALVREANRHFKSMKLRLFSVLLKTVPAVVRVVYQRRTTKLQQRKGIIVN